MSRQRLRESNIKWKINLSNETFVLKILKIVEIKSIENKAKIVDLIINEKINNFINENFLDNLKYFQKKNKISINCIKENNLNLADYIIEFKSKTKKTIQKIESISNLKISKKTEQIEKTSKNKNKNIRFKKKKFYKKKFYKKKTK